MTTAVGIAPSPILQFFDNQGRLLSGGSVLTQAGGVNYPTYQDAGGTTPLPNPIPLNSRGEISNSSGASCQLFLASGVTYTFTLSDANGNVLDTSSAVAGVDAAAVALTNKLASAASTSMGAWLIGWVRNFSSAVATTIGNWLGWQDHDPFEFMSAAMVADVQSGAMTMDHSVAFQACVNSAAGKPVKARKGTFRFDHGITWSTSGTAASLDIVGSGHGTIFVNNTGGPLIDVDGSGTASQYAYGLRLKRFHITSTAPIAGGIGIRLRSQWHGKISQVEIDNMGSHGILFRNDSGDPDSSGFISIERNRITNCGGDGISCSNGVSAAPATGNIGIKRNFIQGNTGAGIRSQGVVWDVDNNEIAACAGGAVVTPYVSSPSSSAQHFNIRNNEFDNCSSIFVDLPAMKQGSVANNKFIYRGNATGIRIGDGGAGVATNIKAERNTHQIVSGTVTAHSIGSNSSFARVEDNYYPTTSGLTKVTDAGLDSSVRDGGQLVYDQCATFTVNTSVSYAPDLTNGVHQRLVITAAGAFTLNNPVNSADGRLLELEIFNSSGGAIAVSFGAGYLVGGYTDPANTKRRTVTLRRHDVSGLWLQVGAWSPDL